MKLSTTTLVRLWFIGALFVLALSSCFDLGMMEQATEGSAWPRYAVGIAWVVWFTAIVKLWLPGYAFRLPPAPVAFFSLFFLWTVFPTMLSNQEAMAFNLLFITTPLLVLLATYNSVRNAGTTRWYVATFCLMGAMLVIQYMRVFSFANLVSEDTHLVSSYYALYILPLILLVRKGWVNAVAVLVAMLVILSSLKRSGVVALVLAVFVFVVVRMYVNNKLKPTTILGGGIALALFAVLFIVLGSMGNETIFERFENIGNDNGSGRLAVWDVTLRLISREDIGTLFLGNGYNMVQMNSPFNLSAHNDFLEVTFDYGLIGLALYVCAVLSTIYYTFRMIGSKSAYAPSMAMMLTIFFVQSMISHIIIYYWASIFMLTIAYLVGNFQKDAAHE